MRRLAGVAADRQINSLSPAPRWLPEQVAAAAPAIAGTEAGNRHGQMGEGGDKRAFVSSRHDPGASHSSRFRQQIDMPMSPLAAPHMARESCPEAAGAAC